MRWDGWNVAIMEREEQAGVQHRYDDSSLFGVSQGSGYGYPTTCDYQGHAVRSNMRRFNS